MGISAPGPWVDELEREGIRHVALESSTRAMDPVADLAAVRELWHIVRCERPTVLHVHNPKPGVYGRIVGRLARVPIVANTLHGLYATEDDPLAKRAIVYGLEAVAARCSDIELVQNPEDLELLRRLHLSPRARLLGNGVDLERFRPPEPHERHAVRASLGIDEDCIVVGTVGRLVEEKGFPELFEAMEHLDRNRFLLLVVGGDDRSKPDALPPEMLARAAANGRATARPPRRRRCAVPRDGCLRARRRTARGIHEPPWRLPPAGSRSSSRTSEGAGRSSLTGATGCSSQSALRAH